MQTIRALHQQLDDDNDASASFGKNIQCDFSVKTFSTLPIKIHIFQKEDGVKEDEIASDDVGKKMTTFGNQ